MLKNMKILTKLGAAFAAVIVAIGAAGALALSELDGVSKNAETLEQLHGRDLATHQLRFYLARQENSFRGWMISHDPYYLERLDSHRQKMLDMVENIRNDEAPQNVLAALVQFESAAAAWRKEAVDAAKALAEANDNAGAVALIAPDGKADQLMGAAEEALDALDETVDASLAYTQEQQLTNTQETMNAVLAGIGIAALISIVAAFLLSRGIVTPLRQLQAIMKRIASGDNSAEVKGADRKDEIGAMAATVLTFRQNAIDKIALEAETERQRVAAETERAAAEAIRAKEMAEDQTAIGALAAGLSALASGDLTHRIEANFAAKTQKLKTDFNAAMVQLDEAMHVISSNSGGIQTGAGEISQAADDLSRRTEQQAASLEETAAALDQITATVKRTAQGAGQANTIVVGARSGAERSGEVVKSAVSAMSQIESSAQQISQIIGVIDEIAFQTNLLALNAGVEAARAGDAGRGFAVVASEVRALAQRSAGAAKEIKGLISESSRQVESGVELVGQAGDSLVRILEQLGRISQLVSEISSSSQEQSTGLSQVNSAVNQMDQVTQQNAAMVEQSTAASKSLAHESEELAALVSEFNIGERAARRPAHAPAASAKGAAKARPARGPVTQMRPTSQRKALPSPAQASPADWEEF